MLPTSKRNAAAVAKPRISAAIIVCLLCLLSAVAAFGQDLTAAKPETVGLSSERLNRIGDAVQRSIDDKRIAGAVTLVVRRGHVAWIKAQGMSDREAGKPMQTDSIFRICSMTKPLTSLAVMMLYEEGRFMLDDPVSRYIPEFKSPKVVVKAADGKTYTKPADREITIRDLLTHSSGITYTWNADLGPLYKQANVADGLSQYDGTIGDSVKKLAVQPLLFSPGEKFEYSLGIDVLGYLVEVVSGKPLDQFFRTRIFEPLGMKDTYFYIPDEKVSRLATAYMWDEKNGLQRFPDHAIIDGNFQYTADYPYRGPKKLFSGGAGLNSTATDYARFCQMLLEGGKLGNVRLISRKTVELMTHDQLGKMNPDWGFGYGFGVSGVKAPLSELGSPGEFGWGGFFYTEFVVDPKEQMITLFMAQLHPTGDLKLNRQMHVLAYQAITD